MGLLRTRFPRHRDPPLNANDMKLKSILENAECPIYEAPNQTVIGWLADIGLSLKLIDALSACSRYGAIKVNKIYFNRFNDLIDENQDEQNKACIDNGYLIVGCGLNGDPIVLSIETEKIGYVSHDELWEDDEEAEFKDMLVMTNLNLSEFYENAFSDDFPVDSYECEEKGMSI